MKVHMARSAAPRPPPDRPAPSHFISVERGQGRVSWSARRRSSSSRDGCPSRDTSNGGQGQLCRGALRRGRPNERKRQKTGRRTPRGAVPRLGEQQLPLLPYQPSGLGPRPAPTAGPGVERVEADAEPRANGRGNGGEGRRQGFILAQRRSLALLPKARPHHGVSRQSRSAECLRRKERSSR
jgi:hypothetical protein